MTDDLKPAFVWSFSLGNVIQIIALIVSVAVVYASLDARSKSNSDALRAAQAELASQELRVRALEQNFARMDERLSSILTLVTRIDAKLERLEGGNE